MAVKGNRKRRPANLPDGASSPHDAAARAVFSLPSIWLGRLLLFSLATRRLVFSPCLEHHQA